MKRKKTNPRKGRSQERGSNSELLSSVSLLTRNLSYPEYKEPTSKEIEALEKIIINGSEEEKEKARNDIFRGSLKYISKIAWSKVNKNPRLYEELFARAVLRVLEGLKDWDPREKPFSKYIKRMIDQEKENWNERSKKEKKHMLFNFDASGSMDQEYNENCQENKQLAISDANMVSEEEIASMMHEWLKKYFESIKELKLCSKGILSAHHQKFFSKALDHGLILQAIEAKLDPDLKALHGIKSLRVSVKKSTYAEHLDWFIPFLEKKFGEKWVKQRSKGEILRKFTNTLNYIWGKVYKNVAMLFILSQIFVRLEYLLPPGVSSLVLGGSIINRVGSHEEFKRLGKFVSEINDHTKMGTGNLLSFRHKKMGDDPFLIRAFLQESYQAEIWIRKRGVKWEPADYETGLRVMRSVLMGEQ